ncbi:hypothetical protein [Streptomyces arenae]|uniref:hypothetical protein n=1 Tax=Streptomyces arenae TaxID=29301 RepID=UPI00265ACC55|nr:hypothetical protein [Streptomyces arenae]MCG7206542.1 hypothetical protein [Streptomyces arenae]
MVKLRGPGRPHPLAYEILKAVPVQSNLTAELEERMVAGMVAGVFNFDRPPMVHDLCNDTERLADHPVIAALAGSHLVIEGPPGMGKSQTSPT